MIKRILFIFLILNFTYVNAISIAETEIQFKKILESKSFLNINEQSFCLQDENLGVKEMENKTVGLNENNQVIPASVSKIFITEMMLAKYGPNYRFTTAAKISKNTLYIYGGYDPFFESKDFLHLLGQITKNKKNPKINKIVFDKSFYINNSANFLNTKQNLQKIIGENKFEKNIFSSNLQILQSKNLKADKSGYVIASDILVDELGKMNFYSNNNAAEVLFNFLD
jgi:D-alanyl-D-alanine carboxypeptidase